MTILIPQYRTSRRASASAASITFLQTASSTTNATSYTFSAQNFGTASSDRLIACAFSAKGGSSTALTSLTIGGVTATLVASAAGATVDDNIVALYVAAVPTGTSGSVVATLNGSSAFRAHIALWSITGANATPHDTDSQNGFAVSVDTPANGVSIVAYVSQSTTAKTWTGGTERYDDTTEAVIKSSGTSDNHASAATLNVSTGNVGSFQRIVGATWGP